EQMADHVNCHVSVAQALARGTDVDGSGELWKAVAGQGAFELMQTMALEAPHGGAMSPAAYTDLFESLILKGEVREPFTGHPLVAFHGHREARETGADLVILGGLADGVWPGATSPDPWLNRKMRKDAGLLLPERQIGLAGHDYQQAAAAPQVVLSRASRDAEAETVPSRWLNRLSNLMEGLPDKNGPQALAAMRERGQQWLRLAAALERPTPAQLADPRLAPAPRPQPQPPVSARPKKLSLTRIATLIRDPYAIYARYILRLRPLDPLRAMPDQRDRGTALHQILEDFVKARPVGEDRTAAKQRLLGIAEQILSEQTPFPSARVLWRARLERAADHFLRQDSKHDGRTLIIEGSGSIRLAETEFELFGTPDRIDELPDGRLHLVDYKTGTPPSKAQQEAYEKQLLLAAAMAERGGFAGLGPVQVARISYLGLGSGDKAVETEVDDEMLAQQWARFSQLIQAYAEAETGYAARRAVFETRFQLDYDHLSRFGEWQMSDRAVPLLVGREE
ncbi:MAG: PD-(D/E)XK nuclease family protein, partial [Paracoccaceae bacterium]